MTALRMAYLVCVVWLSGCTITATTQPSTWTPDLMSLQLSDGQSLAYRVVGKHHSATPILLIHGIPDSSDAWASIAADLGRSHPVYAVDLAGYGYSERSPDYDVSLSAQANYLTEFIDRLGLERVVLVGHDIGGGIAQIIAVRNPQSVDRLVLINSVIDDHWPVLEMRLLRIPLFGYMSLTLMEKPLWKYVLKKGFSNRQKVTDDVIRHYQHWFQGSSGRKRLVRNARALNNTDLTSLSKAIRALAIPTLVLWGRNDRYLDAEPAKKLSQDMKHCRFAFIDDAGHFVLDEQPQSIESMIDQFLKE